jgi:ABC-type oligopeptide transport system substrate-binding subunit/DNA-binding SARP family transcriptional activator
MSGELQLALLGNVEVRRAGVPVTFSSSKAMALLCYLAVTGRPHARPALAGLLWGELPEANARNNLRKALTHLRKWIAPHLSITRQSVAFNPALPYRLDVQHFEAGVRGASPEADIERLQAAVELYQGDFLEGFYVRQALAFEEWTLAQRARLRELALDALHTLAVHHTRRGPVGHEAALRYTTRLLALEPWREEAHQSLMRLLAQSGQRGAALAQYQTCRQVLTDELGVEPGPETTALYERICTGELGRAPPEPTPAALPSFLSSPPHAVPPSFVARERELAQLNGSLDLALAGHGQVVFVTGEAGAGKTALLQELGRRAQETYTNLVVASGNCNAYSGLGDPYLPFRQILCLLTGNVESRWAARSFSQTGACRLWNLVPYTVQAVVDVGPDLVDTFLPGQALITRAAMAAPNGPSWLTGLQELVAQKEAREDSNDLKKSDLFEQYTQVLQALARQRALLLVLDDFQWADAGSISLFFHLGRRLAGARILVICAYRPEEVAAGRDGERHPLDKVLNEFRSQLGDVWVDLGQAQDDEAITFVEAFLDTEPNRLGEDFRRALLEHTEGHPLFTVELLRAMRERGDLLKDENGQWIEGTSLQWETLPARVEGVIGERIGRLDRELRRTLSVASVEGEVFTAQVVAQLRETDERRLIHQLSHQLDKRHRLVAEQGRQKVDHQCVHQYRFRHSLFQHFLYSRLGEIEREMLHRDVGTALETLYQERIEQITPQLAWHFAEAGEMDKAVKYLLLAGDRARALYAHDEAIGHYRRALDFLKHHGDYRTAARTLMKLGLTYHNAFAFRRARQAYEEGFALWEQVGRQPIVPPPPASQVFQVDWHEPVTTLDPTVSSDYHSTGGIDQLFSGLVEYGPDLEIVPNVAQRWEILEGGRTYVFHLRDDVRWSDGVPVTARDFEYAWKRVLTPAIGSPSASLMYDIKGARAFHQGQLSDPEQVGVRAHDQRTLVVELEEPTGYFLQLLTYNVTYPVPRHVVKAHADTWTQVDNIVTNGPFRLEAWQPDECMVLRRNPTYHGRFKGNLQRLELCFVNDPAERLRMYESDSLDVLLLWQLLPAEIDRARQQHPGEYVSGPFLYTLFAIFDVSQPPFDDPRLRRALVMATDREVLADVVMRGTEFPATGGVIPPGMPGHSAEIGLAYDPNQACQLLAEAGYPPGEGPSFPVVDSLAPRSSETVSKYLQTQWREKLKVTTTWETLEWPEFVDRLDQALPHLCLNGWLADYPDPDNFLRVSRHAAHWSGWQNETYETLVKSARYVMDQDARIKLYRQADQILIEEAALMPLTYGRLHMLVKPWVRKFPLSPLKWWFFKDVIVEPH